MAEKVVEPRIRGFICTSSHPEGCASNVRQQVDIAQASPASGDGLGAALVIGSSTGYGLASMLSCCFGWGARTLGVCFERPASAKKTATAGWYNLAEAHRLASEQDRQLETINGDAFSHEIKQQVVTALKERFAPVDLVIYSLASPRRQDPDSETVWNSVLGAVGKPYVGQTVDLRNESVTEVTLDPVDEAGVESTVRVMGGDDWQLWIDLLLKENLLAKGARTVAFSYIGPQVTHPIYRAGSIGAAKRHLEETASELDSRLKERVSGGAWVSVNKAIVTQSSAAIPAVPLYISLLYKVMKERGTHENAIEQAVRLLAEHVGPGQQPSVDADGRIRLDDREMEPDVQSLIDKLWTEVNTENLSEISDWSGFKREFRQLFGFEVDGIDYAAPVEVERPLG